MTMNKIKKTAIMLLIMTLILTGCGSGSGGTEDTGSGNNDTPKEAVAEQDTADTQSSSADDEAKTSGSQKQKIGKKATAKGSVSLKKIPAFSGKAYVAINNNKPDFSKKELRKKSYEKYGRLDFLGRCSTAEACVGRDIMPKEKRGSIGQVKPTGWHIAKYSWVDGKYLYNRCHLIGYQLTGENANEENLITGTRYLNVDGMLPFENMIADYVKETGNHVMYRVTPVFKGRDMVAKGVHMEARSVEDKGDGVSFNVYAYNNQPGVKIDYATGDSSSKRSSETADDDGSQNPSSAASNSDDKQVYTTGDSDKTATYIINTNTKKFHRPSCSSVKRMKASNKKKYKGKRNGLISEGYEPCKQCMP